MLSFLNGENADGTVIKAGKMENILWVMYLFFYRGGAGGAEEIDAASQCLRGYFFRMRRKSIINLQFRKENWYEREICFILTV